MNYIKQVNAFYKLIQDNPLSSNAQCLYNYLLNKDSELGWKSEFSVSNLIVCGFTCLSRQALDRARNELVQKGYIKYKKGHSNQAGKYLIVCFDTQNDTQDSTQDNTQGNTQGGHDVSTLNKQKKTKQKRKSIKKEFVAPTLEEIEKYISEKGLKVDAKNFYDYFTAGNWIDSNGNKVKNWKQKLQTWNSYSKPRTEKKKEYNNYEQRNYDNFEYLYANIKEGKNDNS